MWITHRFLLIFSAKRASHSNGGRILKTLAQWIKFTCAGEKKLTEALSADKKKAKTGEGMTKEGLKKAGRY